MATKDKAIKAMIKLHITMVVILIRVGPFFFLLWINSAWGFIRAMTFHFNCNHEIQKNKIGWRASIPKIIGSETLEKEMKLVRNYLRALGSESAVIQDRRSGFGLWFQWRWEVGSERVQLVGDFSLTPVWSIFFSVGLDLDPF